MSYACVDVDCGKVMQVCGRLLWTMRMAFHMAVCIKAGWGCPAMRMVLGVQECPDLATQSRWVASCALHPWPSLVTCADFP